MRIHDTESSRLVVGVDGSPGSYAAMRWAAQQARQSGGAIEAVYVLEPVVPLDFTGGGFAAMARLDTRALHAAGHELLRRVISAVDGELDSELHAPAIEHIVIENANPGQALVRAARDASMLVVGAHHHHGLGLLLGSTGASCIRQASCPVVVIPEDWVASTSQRSAANQPEEVLT